jgi:hypothetical protein
LDHRGHQISFIDRPVSQPYHRGYPDLKESLMTAPAVSAPFADKMTYYRDRHSSLDVRITHLLGTPVIATGIPLLWAKPRVGVAMFVGGWLVQIAGHAVFEHDVPSTHKGWITYQLTGLIHACEHYGDLLARSRQRKPARRPAVRVPA